ncbi:uncharacterized protein TRUGW13939_06428 [Talaromyces rugulosus]|uniref:Uncharacterized protein n=1 Tax=Talaromyces rugulosus TaxID=121627 RepID=A0A7H8QZV4_TALRU|nr:uncharacterized protein TRUGW13939_06428 [Talaromyces rugulosus]QKX59296.1 hypothetical protein TRUGW13939_06428 [Talaromyces rugulosus]
MDSSKEDQSKPSTESQSDVPEFPEIGHFGFFWKNYMTAIEYKRTERRDLKSNYGTIMLGIFGLSDTQSKNGIEFVLNPIGMKIESLLGSTDDDKRIAGMTVDILNIRCSVISHPFWNGEGREDKVQLEKDTGRVLHWFRYECESKGATLSSDVEEWMRQCRKTMIVHAWKYWKQNDAPCFEEWVAFLLKHGTDSSI